MSELKPCPFCGGIAILYRNGVLHYVICTKCYAKSTRKLTPDEATDAWNRRVGCEAAAEYAKGNRPKDGTWPGEEGEKG